MTLLRSLLIGVLAVAVARPLCGWLGHPRPRVRRTAWVLLLAPYLTPVLLTGYAYSSFSLSLIHHPALNTLFYAALLWWKFTPLAAVILYFCPAPISGEAIHCHRLLLLRQRALPGNHFPVAAVVKRRSPGGGQPPMHLGGYEGGSRFQRLCRGKERRSKAENIQCPASNLEYRAASLFFRRWTFRFRAGCARGPIAAFAVVFLCAFGEFEMASLMAVKSWTVTLFDAHAGGLALGESLRRMLGPLLCEAAAVAIAIAVLARHRGVAARRGEPGRAAAGLGACHLAAAFVFVLLIPAAMVLWGTIQGFGLLFENFVLSREIISSALFAAAAALLAGLAVAGLVPAARSRGAVAVLGKAILLGAVCAGLLGPLVLSLTVLAAVQLPGLLCLRDTPAPLVLALGLVLLPVALVLYRVLELTGHPSALHLTGLMRKSRPARELLWTLSTSGKFWAAVLLFVWAYWDLTASAILAPIGMTPVTVRLYNLMHYGRVAVLSAMTCAAFAAPVLAVTLAWATRRWWATR